MEHLKGFYSNIESDLVAVFETVGNCLGGREYPHFHAVDQVFFDARGNGLFTEIERPCRRIRNPRLSRMTANGNLNLMRDMSRDFVECKRRNKADYCIRSFMRNSNQIWISERWQIGQAIETSMQTFDETTIKHGIKHCSGNTELESLPHPEYATVVAEDILCLFRSVRGFPHGFNLKQNVVTYL